MRTINEFNTHQTALITPKGTKTDVQDSFEDEAVKTSQKEIAFR
jgi:hypothetical protein